MVSRLVAFQLSWANQSTAVAHPRRDGFPPSSAIIVEIAKEGIGDRQVRREGLPVSRNRKELFSLNGLPEGWRKRTGACSNLV
jgi:hypothetical protein